MQDDIAWIDTSFIPRRWQNIQQYQSIAADYLMVRDTLTVTGRGTILSLYEHEHCARKSPTPDRVPSTRLLSSPLYYSIHNIISLTPLPALQLHFVFCWIHHWTVVSPLHNIPHLHAFPHCHFHCPDRSLLPSLCSSFVISVMASPRHPW